MSFDTRRLLELEEVVRGLQGEAYAIGQPTLPVRGYRVEDDDTGLSATHGARLEALEATIRELRSGGGVRVGASRRGGGLGGRNEEEEEVSRLVMVLTQLESLNSAVFRGLSSLLRGIFGLVTRTMAVGAVLVVLYLCAQPLLYASMYHESGVQTGIEAIELVEEGTNTAVQIANTAMDVVRPFQPVWNFVMYWMRRVATLQSRVMLIAIEELVNELVSLGLFVVVVVVVVVWFAS